MFWSSRPGPATSSPTSPSPSSSISRSLHLSSYLNHSILKPSTRKVSNDDTIYDTVFQTTNGFALILRVYLPADASRAPSMTLHGVRASHSWLDIRMKVIGYAPISTDQSWRLSNMKLGDAVYAVIHHFQLTPPSILEITDTNLKRLQDTLPGTVNKPPGQPNNAFPPSASTNFQRPIESNDPGIYRRGKKRVEKAVIEEKVNFEVADDEVDALIPPIPASFLQIDNMPLSELKRMVADDTIMASFVESTTGVKTLKELKQSIEVANVNAAEANLTHEEEIEETCTQLENLKRHLNDKMERYRKLDADRLAITHPPDLQDVIGELNQAKKEAYRESEELADEWVESGGDDVSGFVKKFMEVRLLYHTRAAKAERLGMSM